MAFNQQELLTGTWLKIGEHGYSFRVTFHRDGTFTEAALFGESGASWTGRWWIQAEPPMPSKFSVPWCELHVMVKTPHGTYQLGVNRSDDGLHAGYEEREGDPSHRVRFKFVHVRP